MGNFAECVPLDRPRRRNTFHRASYFNSFHVFTHIEVVISKGATITSTLGEAGSPAPERLSQYSKRSHATTSPPCAIFAECLYLESKPLTHSSSMEPTTGDNLHNPATPSSRRMAVHEGRSGKGLLVPSLSKVSIRRHVFFFRPSSSPVYAGRPQIHLSNCPTVQLARLPLPSPQNQ
jgi:hypothetical protein